MEQPTGDTYSSSSSSCTGLSKFVSLNLKLTEYFCLDLHRPIRIHTAIKAHLCVPSRIGSDRIPIGHPSSKQKYYVISVLRGYGIMDSYCTRWAVTSQVNCCEAHKSVYSFFFSFSFSFWIEL